VRNTFDRRIVPDTLLEFIRSWQKRASCHLGGGAALAGAYLGHRTTGDVGLFFHEASELRLLVQTMSDVAAQAGVTVTLLRDAKSLVRARLETSDARTELDLVHEAVADIEPPAAPIEGVVVESLADLKAAKLTCILSRSEPRDLVDLLFLDRAGHPPERDLSNALRKDAGIDPGVLAWLLSRFPTEPLPTMLSPLSPEELGRFRDDLAERLRRLALPYG
jgi:hypothetical protein